LKESELVFEKAIKDTGFILKVRLLGTFIKSKLFLD